MSLADAKIVLTDLLDKSIADSLVDFYTKKDSLNTSVISLQKKEIEALQLKSINQEKELANLNTIVANNKVEVNDLNEVIKQQKKEIRKQKVLKTLGYIGCVVLPITILILTSH